MANDVRNKMQNPDPLVLDMEDNLVLKFVNPNHAELENLDYEHSGHTGFMPSKLSLLPEVPSTTNNSRLSLSVYNEDTQESGRINLNDFAGRIIKAVSEVPADAQKGQFLFLQISKEE